jgi:hypothetical protein
MTDNKGMDLKILIFFAMPLPNNIATLMATLQTAAADLLWMSETDAPFTGIHWPAAAALTSP